jgi:hypothetical protein
MTGKLIAAIPIAIATLAVASPFLIAPAADAKPKPKWLKKCSPPAKEKDVKVISKHGPFVLYVVRDFDYGFQDPLYRACNSNLGRGRVIARNREPTRVRFREQSVEYRAHFCDGPPDEQPGRHNYRNMRHSLKRDRILDKEPAVYTGKTCITDEDRD